MIVWKSVSGVKIADRFSTHVNTVLLEHRKSTVLDLVGLQVWRGALLLNDFILHNIPHFSNKKVLELGAGTGLTSILASAYSKKVICTGWYSVKLPLG